MSEQTCRFPKRNNLAVASRSIPCGRPAPIICRAFVRESGQETPVLIYGCLNHAAEAATGKLIANLAPTFLTTSDLELLHAAGALTPKESELLRNGFEKNAFFFHRGALMKINEKANAAEIAEGN